MGSAHLGLSKTQGVEIEARLWAGLQGEENLMVDKELLKGSTVTIILAMLAREPMYGYQLIKEIETCSAGVFAFKEGTIYPILHQLESDGMVESYWTGEEGSRQRKFYLLTEKGQLQLKKRQIEWNTFLNAVNRILGEGLSWNQDKNPALRNI